METAQHYDRTTVFVWFLSNSSAWSIKGPYDSLCSLLLSLETPNDVHSVALHSYNIQATSKGSDQTARMRRLVLAFAGRTYHIVGNLMPNKSFNALSFT